MKIFNFKTTNSLWVTTKVILLIFLTNFIYKKWIIYIVNAEKGKKNLKFVSKRWKFSNLKPAIPFEWRPKLFCRNFEQLK